MIAGCIEDEQRVFCRHFNGFLVVIGVQHHVVVAVIAVGPRGLGACAFHNKAFDAVFAVQQRRIRV